MTSIEQQLAAIEAYCEKATEGPWHAITLTGVFDGDPLLILSETVEDAVVASIGADLPEEQANGTFIARARTDLPKLVKLVRELLEREQQLLRELIKRQELGWNFCKRMRDNFESLGCDAQTSLDEMQRAGMDTHLPTFEEMRGFLKKPPSELEEMDKAAEARVLASAITPPETGD